MRIFKECSGENPKSCGWEYFKTENGFIEEFTDDEIEYEEVREFNIRIPLGNNRVYMWVDCLITHYPEQNIRVVFLECSDVDIEVETDGNKTYYTVRDVNDDIVVLFSVDNERNSILIYGMGVFDYER